MILSVVAEWWPKNGDSYRPYTNHKMALLDDRLGPHPHGPQPKQHAEIWLIQEASRDRRVGWEIISPLSDNLGGLEEYLTRLNLHSRLKNLPVGPQ